MTEYAIYLGVGAATVLLCMGLFALARWSELQSTTGSWAFFVAVLRFFGVATAIVSFAWLSAFNLFALLLALGVWMMSTALRRQRTRENLVWILALIANRGLPLAPSVAAYAEECRGGLRWRIVRFGKRLGAGHSLSAALRFDRGILGPLLTADGMAAVAIGAACGDLAEALKEAARTSAARRSMLGEILSRLLYLGVVLLSMIGIVVWMIFRVIPRYTIVFRGYSLEMTPATIFVIGLGENVRTYFPAFLAMLALASIPFLVVLTLLWRFTTFNIPLARGVLLNRHVPALLRAFAGVVERGQPLAAAVGAIAKGYPTPPLRRRMRAIEEDLNRGAQGWEAFAQHGILTRADVDVLNAAARLGNLPWAMRALADGRERRQNHRIQLAMQILWPLLILVIGVVVGMFIVALILPLTELIDKLSYEAANP